MENKKKRQLVCCEECGSNFEKFESEIRRTKHNFCSKSCSVLFSNRHRDRSFYKRVKETNCIDCGQTISVALNASIKLARCKDCKKKIGQVNKDGNLRGRYIVDKLCKTCGAAIKAVQAEYCENCRHTLSVEIGMKAGKASAAKQIRRSKNEIYFAELCAKEFANVSTNDQRFISKYGNWDCDIALNDHKIAVLWNGIWHYKQVRKAHSLQQVQARDKIKIDVIRDNGYDVYIIRDMGKANKKFVEEQFQLFKEYIKKKSI